MSLNGKRDNFHADDLLAFARSSGIKKYRAKQLLQNLSAAVGDWKQYAEQAGVSTSDRQRIEAAFRMHLLSTG